MLAQFSSIKFSKGTSSWCYMSIYEWWTAQGPLALWHFTSLASLSNPVQASLFDRYATNESCTLPKSQPCAFCPICCYDFCFLPYLTLYYSCSWYTTCHTETSLVMWHVCCRLTTHGLVNQGIELMLDHTHIRVIFNITHMKNSKGGGGAEFWTIHELRPLTPASVCYELIVSHS